MHYPDLPWPKTPAKGKPPAAKDHVLTKLLVLEQWTVPAGTQVRLIVGQNFGYVVLPKECKDIRGFSIPKRIFRF